MATKRKEETSAVEVQHEENQEQPVAVSDMEAAPEQAPEIPQTSEEAADTFKPSVAETKTSDEGANEPVEKPARSKMESLSVLADRHRIPAWHQAALLRYMGWQDDKMVTDEDYRDALDELKHRRIGGGRK